MNDKKILELFKTGQREKAFKKLYRLYPQIEALIISKGGQKQNASDVFQVNKESYLKIDFRTLKDSQIKSFLKL